MKPISLHIQNFGSIRDLVLPLDQQGMVLLMGKNEDAPKAESNGSGKSLLLDALTWCLWDQTVRGFSHDEVVNEAAGKDCVVTFRFSDGGVAYSVSRYRKNKSIPSKKPNDLELLREGVDISGTGIADTQRKVDNILGLDFTTFCAMMPGAGVRVSEMTDKEIKVLLETLLQTEVLTGAHERVREELKDIQRKKQAAAAGALDLSKRIDELTKQIIELESNGASFEEKKEARLASIASKEKDVATRLSEKEDWVTKAGDHDAFLAKAKEDVDKVNSELIALKDQETKELAVLARNKADLKQSLSAYKAELDIYKNQYARASKLEGGSICPTCMSSIDPAHKASVCDEAARLVASKEDDIRKVLQSLKAEEAAELVVGEKYAPLLKDALNIQSRAQLAYEKEAGVGRLLSTAKEEIARLAKELEELRAEHKDVQGDVNPFFGLVERATARRSEQEKGLEDLRKQEATLTEQASFLEFWLEGFSPSGIRSYMLEYVTPLLNAYAAKYADMLTGGEMEVTFHTKELLKGGDLKEKFNIQVKQRHGGSTYSSNSAGERARANLVIAMAIGDLATLRTNRSIPFRFLDEPFEHVDESGTSAIVSLLNMQKDRYETVFVITHQEHFKSLFDARKTIVKKNGISQWSTDE